MFTRSDIKKPYAPLVARMLNWGHEQYGILWFTPRRFNGFVHYVYHPRDNIRVEVTASYKGAIALLRFLRQEELLLTTTHD